MVNERVTPSLPLIFRSPKAYWGQVGSGRKFRIPRTRLSLVFRQVAWRKSIYPDYKEPQGCESRSATGSEARDPDKPMRFATAIEADDLIGMFATLDLDRFRSSPRSIKTSIKSRLARLDGKEPTLSAMQKPNGSPTSNTSRRPTDEYRVAGDRSNVPQKVATFDLSDEVGCWKRLFGL